MGTEQIVVVTGASQGIGRAVALAYAASGARLALLARNESNLKAVAEEVRQRGGEALVVPCDVTDEAQVARAEPAVREALGVPHVLVNNAGLFQPGGFLEITPEAFRQQVEVNLTSAFLVTRAFLPAMLERGGASGSAGDVVFMASIASLRGYPGGSAYGAAKHGLRQLLHFCESGAGATVLAKHKAFPLAAASLSVTHMLASHLRLWQLPARGSSAAPPCADAVLREFLRLARSRSNSNADAVGPLHAVLQMHEQLLRRLADRWVDQQLQPNRQTAAPEPLHRDRAAAHTPDRARQAVAADRAAVAAQHQQPGGGAVCRPVDVAAQRFGGGRAREHDGAAVLLCARRAPEPSDGGARRQARGECDDAEALSFT